MAFSNSIFSFSQFIFFNSKRNLRRKFSFLKPCPTSRINSFSSLFKMQTQSKTNLNKYHIEKIGDEYKIKWINLIESATEIKNENSFVYLNKNKIPIDESSKIEAFLVNNFRSTQMNVFDFHLSLIEYIAKRLNFKEKVTGILFISLTFEKWFREQQNQNQNNNLITTPNQSKNNCTISNDLTRKAFVLATQNLYLLSNFNKIYKFKEQKSKFFAELDLLSEIVIPLLIEGKFELLDDFINKSDKDLMSSIMECLNHLCDPETNLKKIAEHHGKSHCTDTSITLKSSKLSKYAINTLKKFNKLHDISKLYPNILNAYKLNQLKFLINMKCSDESSISVEAWKELILDLVQDNKILKVQLISDLITKDISLAKFFIGLFGLQFFKELDSNIHEVFRREEKIKKKSKIDDKCHNQYYTCDLDEKNVVFVDKEYKFKEMLNYFETKEIDIIGLDCEWKPIFGNEDLTLQTNTSVLDTEKSREKNKRANILQIATREKIFILEIKHLVDNLNELDLIKFGDLILFSNKSLKLGFSFDQDAKKLLYSFSIFKHQFSKFCEQLVDIEIIVKRAQKLNPNLFPVTKLKNDKIKLGGLSGLTRLCFGKSLDKSECMSNWSNIPLRKEQLMYAAIDAFVLIKIFDYVQEKCKALNIPLKNLIKQS